MFAGQRADAFHVDLGSIFDLGALRPLNTAHLIPMATMDGINSVQAYNVHTIAIQVPISDLTKDGSTPTNVLSKKSVIGVWSTASRRKSRIYDQKTGMYVGRGPWKQVSRLGNPLFNEVITPMAEKDQWNSRPPHKDAKYTKYVNKPELGGLLPALYPGKFDNLAAYKKPRADLNAILLTGIPKGIVPGFQNFTGATQADMLRLNVAVPPSNNPNDLGLVAGDAAGFPNGRRLNDDVVTIELRAVAGLTIPLVDPATRRTTRWVRSRTARRTPTRRSRAASRTWACPVAGTRRSPARRRPPADDRPRGRADGEPARRAGRGPARHRGRHRRARGHHAPQPGRRGSGDPSRRPGRA